jgi:hypothetical protein
MPWVASANTWRAKVLLAKGRVARAHGLAGSAAVEARSGRSHWHEAEALLTQAEAALQGGIDCASAITRANRLIRLNGYQSMRWRVPVLRCKVRGVGWKLSLHRESFRAIIEDRVLVSSPTSKSAYLRDKRDAISAYLAELLVKPTPARIREAIAAVAESRSAALIDEMLSSEAIVLQPEQVARLEELRAELQSLQSESSQPGSRRAAVSHDRIAGLQRRWIETTHRLLPSMQRELVNERSTAVVFARAGEHLYALKDHGATRLPISRDELERQLRWLRFELLAPMADRSTCAIPAMQAIRKLSSQIIEPWWDGAGASLALCPEDQFWQVPWTACFESLGSASEPILALHPTLSKISDRPLDSASRAMIWIHRSQDLQYAEGEERSFLQCFPNAVVCRTATEAREALSEEVEVLHVICHAQHNVSNPMFSALLFGDGALYATEIARSGLRPGLVSLSACETGNVNVTLRDEPDGLARAFLARGAKTVIGSQWPLDDEAAALMYSTLFSKLTAGATIVDAMKSARCDVEEWNPHPYFWGALALFGGYGR